LNRDFITTLSIFIPKTEVPERGDPCALCRTQGDVMKGESGGCNMRQNASFKRCGHPTEDYIYGRLMNYRSKDYEGYRYWLMTGSKDAKTT